MQAQPVATEQEPAVSNILPEEGSGGISEILRTPLSIWLWLEIAVVSILAFLFSSLALVLFYPFDRRRIIAGHIVRLGSVSAVKLNPMWKFDVRGQLPRPLPKKTVFVSNHCSHTDPFLIAHLPVAMRWLAKASLFKIPFLGWAMRIAGDIAVKRGDANSAREAMKKCADWLDQGVSVVIFPEGTRSKTAELLPFKNGAFRLAIETGADILPLAVAGTHTALRKHDWKAGYSHGHLNIGQPISTQGMTLEDVPVLRERVRAEIVRLRAELGALSS
ncbi:MAG: lysophospholipid acyltransferase family protein [Polyangiaceae bacterium]|nr:lysophospholipid acyltransferase family protein [Polyangiaceae bacterium]